MKHGRPGYSDGHGETGYCTVADGGPFGDVAHAWSFNGTVLTPVTDPDYFGKDTGLAAGKLDAWRDANGPVSSSPSTGKNGFEVVAGATAGKTLYINSPVYSELTGTFTWTLWPSIDGAGGSSWFPLYFISFPSTNVYRLQQQFVAPWTLNHTFTLNSSGGGASVAKSSSVMAGRPFVVIQHDSAAKTIRIRVNDSAWASNPYTGSAFPNITGDRQFGRFFISAAYTALDEVYFWKRLLADAEIDWLWNGGAGNFL